MFFKENEQSNIPQQPVYENNFGGSNQYNNYMEYKDFQQQPSNNGPSNVKSTFQPQETQKKENNLLDF